MLSVEHVTKRFGTFTALEDVSLTFEPGVYGLVAPNGAGKTTLIKMLATLFVFPTEGQILWDGEDIVSLGESYRARLGYLPQEFGYYPADTPRQFLRYVAALQRIPRTVADPRIDELLETVGIAEVAGKQLRRVLRAARLQRVGIAQAMVNDPELLILDEADLGAGSARARALPQPCPRAGGRPHRHPVHAHRVRHRNHRRADRHVPRPSVALLRQRLQHLRAAARPGVRGSSEHGPGTRPASAERARRGAAKALVLRIASDEPPAQGTPVAACLEDAFLYIYRDVEEGERP